jgi:hypothetical protein
LSLKNKKKKSTPQSEDSKQPSVSTFFKKHQCQPDLQKSADELILKFVVKGLHAMAIVEEDGFKELIGGLTFKS